MQLPQLDIYERKPMTEVTRRLLCHFATGDAQRDLPYYAEVDWAEVCQAVSHNGLLPLTYHFLKQQVSQDYPPPEFRQAVQQLYRLKAIRMALLYRHVGQVLQHLTEAGLEYLVVKGPAVAHTIYPQPALRGFNDLDLVVRERDWGKAHRLLIEMGFEPEKDWPEPPPKLGSQEVLYELKYWSQEMGLRVEVHYDDILNAGLASRDIEGFWQRAITVQVADTLIRVLSLEDQLIHLCAHAHYHGYTRLSWFSDLAFIVRDHGAELNWGRLIETTRIEEAQVPVYYSLYFLEQLLGIQIPIEVLNALRPDDFRCRWHERYMPVAEVLSFQPMCRPIWSFYFHPLLERLLPDLLVMGRRREKLHYLLRLLCPPPSWLQYYYGLTGKQLVLPHYLLHLLKLSYHYLTEIITAVSRKRIPGLF